MAFFSTHNLKGDIYGGLTTGVIALPLALAFGAASGAGPIAGVWGAIIVGFFASLFGGAGPQVSGPTGPMMVVFAGLYAALADHPALVFSAMVLAGALMIIFGLLRMGQYIKLVPYPVISGFMTGIGCIIIALQFARLFGHQPDGAGIIAAVGAVPLALSDPVAMSVFLSAMTLGIVFFWPASWGRYVPSTLVALVIGTMVSINFPGSPVLGDIPTGLPDFMMPTLTMETFWLVFQAALILALLGSIDSLLNCIIIDNMIRQRCDTRQELIGQGIGNALAGLFGGLPGSGATMRTVLNMRIGGRTKISGMIHAGLLFMVVMVLAPIASKIPHAVLAGILIKVGYDIIDWSYLRRAHKGPRWDLLLMAVVLVLTVMVDLITAVGVGVVLAALAYVKEIADLQLAALASSKEKKVNPKEREILEEVDNHVMIFDFSGPLSFGAVADLVHHVRVYAEGQYVVILDFTQVPSLDVSAAKAVETIAEDVLEEKRLLYISGANRKVAKVLSALEIDKVVPQHQWYPTRLDAITSAAKHVKKVLAAKAKLATAK